MAEESEIPTTGLSPDRLLPDEEGINPGLKPRHLNTLRRFYAQEGETPPPFFHFRQFCQENPQAWFMKIRQAETKGAGDDFSRQVQALLAYLDWVDTNYPDGVPEGAFEISLPSSIDVATSAIFITQPGGERPGCLPILDNDRQVAVAQALERGDNLITIDEEKTDLWEEEVRLLRKYYGIALRLERRELSA